MAETDKPHPGARGDGEGADRREVAGADARADYASQDRGDDGAYERYLRAMDASMKQKVALTAAHLLCRGRVADMGMGSGGGSRALAALYPELEVIGVDINPEMVRRAAATHKLPNLRFVEGDIAAACLPEASLDGIFDSSVLHHVTSFNGYSHQAALEALAVQTGLLRRSGVLIVRDFLAPESGDGSTAEADEVVLELPADDARPDADPREREPDGPPPTGCSTMALFERFAAEFRKLADAPGFAWQPVVEGEITGLPACPPGRRRVRLARRHAVEFLLRKDYRADWASEVLEEYTFATIEEFERCYAGLGLRVLAATPIRNPWIVTHRFEGQVRWFDSRGHELDWPATNIVMVGEKAPEDEGVRIEAAGAAEPLGFLELEHYRDARDGRIMDLVRRPNLTCDVLPWFVSGGELFVLARRSYPRPILAWPTLRSEALDESRASCYVTEPLAALQSDRPLGRTVEDILLRRVGLEPEQILGMRPGRHYAPSPGGVEEEVRSMLVEISPVVVHKPLETLSGLSTSGVVRAIEARQALRAAQVGGLPNARVELNIHELMLGLGRDPGSWIGQTIELEPRPGEAFSSPQVDLEELERRPPRRCYSSASAADSQGFLSLHSERFVERAADGRVVAECVREFVLPARHSLETIAVALLRRTPEDQWLIGIDDDDLPAAQSFTGRSDLLVAPAWRLPREVAGRRAALAWLRERLEDDYGLEAGRIFELGGRWFPSPGATPEAVTPLAIEALGETGGGRPLLWLPLTSLLTARGRLQDGHLNVLVFRAAHALGLLSTLAKARQAEGAAWRTANETST